MDPQTLTALSKRLSLVLRHDPASVGLELDRAGWVEVERLLERLAAHGSPLTREVLDAIVATSPKRRFALSDDGRRIRASQGHSVEVDLGYQPAAPPEVLFHGTVAGCLQAIRAEGLSRMGRHHVHLSPDPATARTVAARRGAPVVLTVDAARMARDRHAFYRSANGVWLTERVPPAYLAFPP